jgi:hypothetical protein
LTRRAGTQLHTERHTERHPERAINFAFWKISHFVAIFQLVKSIRKMKSFADGKFRLENFIFLNQENMKFVRQFYNALNVIFWIKFSVMQNSKPKYKNLPWIFEHAK